MHVATAVTTPTLSVKEVPLTRSSPTTHHDLHTGTPLWTKGDHTQVAARRLTRSVAVDVAVVGAGVSGALMAHALTRRGLRVAVLDRRAPMLGSTSASTALLLYEIDRPLYSLARRIGHDKALRAWRRSVRAVEHLRALVHDERIACGWREMDSLLLAGDAFGHRALQMEVEARGDADISGTFLAGAGLRERFAIERTGAILSGGSAVADPVRLTAGVLRHASRHGAAVYSPAEVVGVASGSGEVRLAMRGGEVVTAAHAVFCTGYELLHGVPTRGHSLESTWAFATAPGATYPDWLDHTVVWEASDPYLYLRSTPDGRLIVGGEDEPTAERHRRPALFRQKMRTLERKLRQLIPELRFRVDARWAGTFGDSASGLPRIDAVPGLPHCHYVMGFGGNGITNSVIAAELVSAAITGRTDPDTDVYRDS
jgi:glycine/D-amino acid oxidase-like deaminating enzyme